jgi:hypothetical protein
MLKMDPEDLVSISNRFITVAGLMVGLALLGAAWLLVSAILLVWRFREVPGSAVGSYGKREDDPPRHSGFGETRAPVLSLPSNSAT